MCTSVVNIHVPGTVSWSPDGQYLATVNDNMPGAVWVWELATMELCSVVMTMAPVRAAKWAPQVGRGG